MHAYFEISDYASLSDKYNKNAHNIEKKCARRNASNYYLNEQPTVPAAHRVKSRHVPPALGRIAAVPVRSVIET